MKVDKLFCEELAGIVRNCDYVSISYSGLMEWEFGYQMTDSEGIKSYFIGEDELRYLEKYHKELCESRGILFDEPEDSEEGETD